MNRFLKALYSRGEYRLMGLTPRRLRARLNGPRIIVNSMPKSGTHLLMRCLMHFPTLSYSGNHYTKGFSDVDTIRRFLKRNGNGRYSAAHLWYEPEIAEVVRSYSFKTILIVRDPRDIVVSGTYYIMNRKNHHLHDYFQSLKGMDDRVRAYIKGVRGKLSSRGIELPSIAESYEKYIMWDREDYNMVVKFQDLIGIKGGGSLTVQREVIEKVARHVGIELSESEIEYVVENMFSKKSVTFRKGKAGGWNKDFSAENKELFKQVTGDLLMRYGYEETDKW